MHDNVAPVGGLDCDKGLEMFQEVDLIVRTLARIRVKSQHDRFVCSKRPENKIVNIETKQTRM